MFFKAPIRVIDFDEITKLISLIFLNVFFAEENEEVCRMIFEAKEKENFLSKKKFFTSIL